MFLLFEFPLLFFFCMNWPDRCCFFVRVCMCVERSGIGSPQIINKSHQDLPIPLLADRTLVPALPRASQPSLTVASCLHTTPLFSTPSHVFVSQVAGNGTSLLASIFCTLLRVRRFERCLHTIHLSPTLFYFYYCRDISLRIVRVHSRNGTHYTSVARTHTHTHQHTDSPSYHPSLPTP